MHKTSFDPLSLSVTLPILPRTHPEAVPPPAQTPNDSGVRVARGWREGVWLAVKSNAAEEAVAAAPFVDLIACERECRTCSYAASLDCDGNCGVCPHNGYCPCVNPVVARSKTALKIIELRPILLQDLQTRN